MALLFLVHHADAVASEVDPQRPLSDSGRAHVQWLAATAAARGVKPAAIWHSGKLRARQTAEAFWNACNPFAAFSAARGLQPTDTPEVISDRLAAESRDLMLVGHMPHMERLHELLLRKSAAPRSPFPQHGLVALERTEENVWTEIWRLTR